MNGICRQNDATLSCGRSGLPALHFANVLQKPQSPSFARVQEGMRTWAPTGPLGAMGACTQRTRAVVMRPFGRCRKLASSKVSVSLSGAYEASCTSDMRSVFVPGTPPQRRQHT